MIDRRHLITMPGLGLASLAFTRPGWPEASQKLTRIMVGFPPGGSLDVVARLISEELKGFAETVIVENRQGAGGRAALEAVKNSPADGTVMVLTPGDQLALFPHIYKSLTYDPLRDFSPVTSLCSVQFLLTIGPMVPASVDTLDAFVAWCRANPGKASYGTPGAGTRQHFIGDRLARAAGIEFVHVPYRGAPPAMQDLIAGQIAANISVISTTLPNIEAGKLRALLTSASKRSVALPQVPTAREVGYPSLEAVETFGLLLPRGASPATVQSLNAAVRQALSSTQVRQGLAKLSFEPTGSTPAGFAALIKSDLDAWSEVVRSSGFKQLD